MVQSSSHVVQMLEIEWRNIIHAVAESTLIPPSTLDELHKGAHVGFAPVASHWTTVTVIYQEQWSLIGGHCGKGLNDSSQWNLSLLGHIRCAGEAVRCTTDVSGTGIALVLDHTICGDQGGHLPSGVGGIYLCPSGDSVILDHLDRAGN